jgi:hypothetical protein
VKLLDVAKMFVVEATVSVDEDALPVGDTILVTVDIERLLPKMEDPYAGPMLEVSVREVKLVELLLGIDDVNTGVVDGIDDRSPLLMLDVICDGEEIGDVSVAVNVVKPIVLLEVMRLLIVEVEKEVALV